MDKPKSPSALIALNPFKGTLTNAEACDIVAEALAERARTRVLPVGDGGRGTLWALKSARGGEIAEIPATGPLGKPVTARVLCLPDAARPETVFIESAETCGYQLVPEAERDLMRATSFGLGEVLIGCVSRWASLEKILVGLGDSITADAGMGMLSALGLKFHDNAGREIWGNANGLRWIHSITLPRRMATAGKEITVLCDVLNPLCGSQGSAAIFAPQKGGSPSQISLIEQGMENFAVRVFEILGQNIKAEPMTGAAGGLAAAFRAFLQGQLVAGASYLLDLVGFDRLVKDFDVVVTGEGTTDAQTLAGKAPFEIIQRAQAAGVKSIVLSGQLGPGHQELLKHPSVLGCYAVGNGRAPQEALRAKAEEIFAAAERWFEDSPDA